MQRLTLEVLKWNSFNISDRDSLALSCPVCLQFPSGLQRGPFKLSGPAVVSLKIDRLKESIIIYAVVSRELTPG